MDIKNSFLWRSFIKLAVLVGPSGYNTTPETAAKPEALASLGSGSWNPTLQGQHGQAPAQGLFGCGLPISSCALTGRKAQSSARVPLLQGTRPIPESSALMCSALPKGLLPHTITLRTGVSTDDFLKDTNIQTTAPTILRDRDSENQTFRTGRNIRSWESEMRKLKLRKLELIPRNTMATDTRSSNCKSRATVSYSRSALLCSYYTTVSSSLTA